MNVMKLKYEDFIARVREAYDSGDPSSLVNYQKFIQTQLSRKQKELDELLREIKPSERKYAFQRMLRDCPSVKISKTNLDADEQKKYSEIIQFFSNIEGIPLSVLGGIQNNQAIYDKIASERDKVRSLDR